MRRALFAALCFAVVLAAAPASAKTFKIATLAPEGSTWWKVFKKADKRLRELSGGKMKIKLYAGGVAGDEPDLVRKMRVGQLHGAAVTSVGLAEIQPALLVLQAPGLFQSWDELDAVRNKMSDRFKSLLADKGFEVLLWGDVGFNRVFANEKIETPDQMKGTKPWCWTHDGVFKAYYEAIGATPVMLGVPDVLPGLQTGLVDAYTTPPLVAVSLQWFNRSKYMLDLPLTVTIGAIVVRKKTMDGLSEDERKWMDQVIAELTPVLYTVVREDNQKAIGSLSKAGLTVVKPTAQMKSAWAAVSAKGADAAAGTVYPKELLDEVRKNIKEYRAGGGK